MDSGSEPRASQLIAHAKVLPLPVLLLGALLVLRNLSDVVTDFSVLGGLRLNLGALLGIAAIAYAITLVIGGGRRLVGTAVIITVALTLWLLIGFLNYGVNAGMLREWIRLISIVAVMVVAANLSSLSPRIAVSLVIVSMILPVIVADVQLLTNLADIGPEQTRRFFRVTGTFVQANKAAQAFVVLLFLSVWLVSIRWAWVGALMAIGSAAALLGTRSMGGLVAAVVAAVAVALLYGAGSRRLRVGIVVGVLLLAVVFALSPFGASRIDALDETRLPWDVVGRTSNSLEWRLYNWWLLAWEWLERPFLGHGLGATLQAVTPVARVTHSDPVRVIVETGIVGTLLATAGIVALVRRIVAILRRLRRDEGLITRLVAAITIGLGVQTIVQNTLSHTALMYVLAVLLVGVFMSPGSNQQTQPT